MDERRDMQGLNDRLASFLNRLRQLQANAGQMDTSAYHAAIKSLEDEIGKLKAMYEAELDRLRWARHRAQGVNGVNHDKYMRPNGVEGRGLIETT